MVEAAAALAESTGQRVTSILRLRREDVDLGRAPHGWILFKGESQKTGYEQWVPLTKAVRDLMVRICANC